ncbi:MAG: signal peptidase II [Gammaproteobacteria bacterium]|jgi:signal peptidase II|nr:signal peptidase II [Gammaproteobacteria bacterium]
MPEREVMAVPARWRDSGLCWLWLSTLVLVLDQASKLWADAALQLYQRVELLPGINLTLVYNRGAAFSLLSDAAGWQRWLFAIFALIISVVILVWLRRVVRGDRLQAGGLALVLGGAIGNVWDRLVHGHVIDFIDVHYRDWHWPAFNIADSAITVGVVLLLAETLFVRREPAPG